jgi:DNA invertase Pin-like site-specific DNA recombinase
LSLFYRGFIIPKVCLSKRQEAMAIIGYARVSATDQDFNGQIDRLKASGCVRIYSEKASGKSTNGRPELAKAIKALMPGDTLLTIKLDRLARSLKDLLALLEEIALAGAKFRALDDPWCATDSPQGELIMNLMASLAQFERKLIHERCAAGIARAKRLGKKFGRPIVLDAGQRRKIAERYGKGETMEALARDYEVGIGTIWRALH